MLRTNINNFLEKAFKIHGGKYGYLNLNYKGIKSKGIFTCEKHGNFEQAIYAHLRGQGCPKCVIENKNLSEKEVIKRFREIHGDRFGYDKVIYLGFHIKVIIICPIHGEFLQSPADHLGGHGCSKCMGDIAKLRLSSNIEEFIPKAIEVHGVKNDYSKFIYINIRTKGCITCLVDPRHGDYWQSPNSHLRGQGCPRCKKSKGELAIIDILDKNDIDFKDEYKLPEILDNYRYDFYLPDYRLLIEFHGRQHYEYIEHFHGDEDIFLARKNTDDIKKDNAYRFKYRLLEFNYKQLKHLSKEQFEEMVISKITTGFLIFSKLQK